MDKRLDIELKRQTFQFKKDSLIKECFHFDKEKCSDTIISAHSLQRNGVLSLLEEMVDGNLSVYSFLHIKYDEKGSPVGFEPLGKKVASTFFGFCGHHDTNIFETIENNPVDLTNDEHCFLLSYRAFAKDYHAKQETLQGYRTNNLFQEKIAKKVTNGMIEGSKIGLRDSDIVKARLNEILKRKEFDQLDYFTYELDYMVPIALSASITPDYSYMDELLNKSVDPNVEYEFVNFVIQPTSNGRTLILLSCLPEQKKSIKFIDQLSNLNEVKLEKAISSVAITNVENTFISPLMWNKFSSFEKGQLLKEIYITNPIIRGTYNKFYHSKVNLLDKKFKKKRYLTWVLRQAGRRAKTQFSASNEL